MARIVFDVTSTALQADLLVLTRDGKPMHLPLVDGRASADLAEGGYDLFWSLRGPPGTQFHVVARQGGAVLLEAWDAIPPRHLRQAGGAYFGVKGRELLRALKTRTNDDNVTPLFPEASRVVSAAPHTLAAVAE